MVGHPQRSWRVQRPLASLQAWAASRQRLVAWRHCRKRRARWPSILALLEDEHQKRVIGGQAATMPARLVLHQSTLASLVTAKGSMAMATGLPASPTTEPEARRDARPLAGPGSGAIAQHAKHRQTEPSLPNGLTHGLARLFQ